MENLLKMLVEWLKGSPKWTRCVVPLLLASIAAIWLCSSCGITRTTVRTSGKGTTNASVSVTTNNPNSVDVSTQIDSIPISITSKKNK